MAKKEKGKMMHPYYLDLETSGFKSKEKQEAQRQQQGLHELAVVDFRGKPICYHKFKIEEEVEPEWAKITGLSKAGINCEAEPATKIKAEKIRKKLYQDGRILVTFNAAFDKERLQAWFSKLKLEGSYVSPKGKWVCLQTIAWQRGLDNTSLRYVASELGEDWNSSSAHTAKADADLARRCHQKLVKMPIMVQEIRSSQ